MEDYYDIALRMIEVGRSDPEALRDAFEVARMLEMQDAVDVDEELVRNHTNFARAHELSRMIRTASAKAVVGGAGADMLDLHKRCLLFDAPYDFDAFCRYIEWDRPRDRRFYEPRRKRLKEVADALQLLADDKLDLLGISLPPGVGKTTIAIFFLCWLAGKNPDEPILGGSHSNSFLRGVYEECQRIFDPEGEYLWHDVFPNVSVCSTNAKDMRLDLGHPKRFQTLQFSSVGSGNAGKVRAQQLLYCDDLVEGIEQAMSRERMDKLWQQYTTDLRQRKIGNCKELHIATRWSVHDPLGRLEAAYGDDPRSRFIRFPAMNENDESNFDYGNSAGFTTQFYRQQREIMDDASWRALFMNEPVEREGQLVSPDELRRYFMLPDREPDAILAVVDTKDQGTDYCVMPIVYQYGNDFYLEKIICDNGKPDVVEARLVDALCEYKVQMARFESNRGGGRIAETVQKAVSERGGQTRITTKWNQANKETRIIVSSTWYKRNMLFKDDSVLKDDKEYRLALQMLTGYTMAGKNKHDDVPDALASFADFVQSFESNRVEIRKRPF